jgi:YegS/Rv2252/BmrU family lipid kinase
MPRVQVIVNPNAGRGLGAQVSPRISRYLNDLHVEHDLVHTRAPLDAIALAQRACEQGYETIVAVGGDGTTNEVMNGMMAHANGGVAGTLACIPAGSGNDFAFSNGVPAGIEDACQLIATGRPKLVDVGEITFDGQQKMFFDNTLGIGFDGLVSIETRKHKRLRGMALYVPAVLRTLLVTLHPLRTEISIDGEIISKTALMCVVANGPREGRTFLVAPNARTDDGVFDIITVGNMPRLSLLALVPRFMSGTHLSHPLIEERHGRDIAIRSEDPMHLHVDGEIPCEVAHEVAVRMLPGRLRVLGG